MSDIQRLRQQQLFDINTGTPLAMGSMDMPDMGGYEHQDPYNITMGGRGGPTNPTQGTNQVMPMQLPPVQSGSVDPTQSYKNMIDAINQIYTPETVDRDRNRNLLDNFPTMQQPSGGQRWTAALMGLGERNTNRNPIDTMDRVLLGPHMRDVTEWQMKTQPFGQAAQIENNANVNERNLANNVITQQRYYNDQQERSRIADEKLKTERLRSEAYAFKQMHPNWKFDFSGPTGFAYNPANPNEKVNLGPTGNLSDADRINLQGQFQVEAAAARNAGMTERAEAGAWTVFQQDGKTYEHNRITGEIRPTKLPSGDLVRPGTARPAQDKPVTAKEDSAQQQNRWRELYDTDPTVKKHMKNNNGSLIMDKGHSVGSMPWHDSQETADEHNRVMQQLYPNYKPPSMGNPPSSGPNTKGPIGDGVAEPGKVSPRSRQEQQQRIQSGEVIEVYDQAGNPVGVVPNSPAGRAEAARLGYKVR